jgi:hypothetical protein
MPPTCYACVLHAQSPTAIPLGLAAADYTRHHADGCMGGQPKTTLDCDGAVNDSDVDMRRTARIPTEPSSTVPRARPTFLADLPEPDRLALWLPIRDTRPRRENVLWSVVLGQPSQEPAMLPWPDLVPGVSPQRQPVDAPLGQGDEPDEDEPLVWPRQRLPQGRQAILEGQQVVEEVHGVVGETGS